MKFPIADFIFSPFVLIFAAIFLGMLFGNLKIKSFSFGGAGPLFIGLLIGWGVLKYAHAVPQGSENYAAAQSFIKIGVINNLLFNTFLVLFVTAIGLLASNSIVKVVKKYGLQFVILGFLITFVGAAATVGMTKVLPQFSPYKISGTYTGAMTSSPGLAADLEATQKEAKNKADHYTELSDKKKHTVLMVLNEYYAGAGEEDTAMLTLENTQTLTEEQKADFVEAAMADTGIGHSIAFPFGSLVVIISMTFLHRIFRIDLKKEKEEFAKLMKDTTTTAAHPSAKAAANEPTTENSKKKGVVFDVAGFSLAALCGLILGNINISLGSLGHFSLGNTGGALLGGLAFGAIGKIGFINFRMDDKVLQVLRTLCLEIFLAIVGLKYGYGVVQAVTGSGLIFAAVSFVIGMAALMSGFLVGRYVMKLNYILLSGAICGGMTNTTGMGTLLDVLESDDAATGYGATFPFAVIGMVLFSILMRFVTG